MLLNLVIKWLKCEKLRKGQKINKIEEEFKWTIDPQFEFKLKVVIPKYR